MKKLFQISNLHLLLSTLIVIPAAFVYGFFTNFFFNVEMNSINEASIFKAIMGLYLAFASLWLLGIFKTAYWKAATISNILFMAGLVFGRIISILLDGMPSFIFSVGIIGELVLAIFSVVNLSNFDRKSL